MKVLMAVEPASHGGYVRPLVQALEAQGVTVACSVERTLEPAVGFDVVHVHWPEALCTWEEPREACVDAVRRALLGWKERGVPVVLTRHNALPHLHRGPGARELYRTVQASADALIHLGPADRGGLELRDGAAQVTIPHGCDAGLEPEARGRAREELALATDDFVVLIFGAVRTFAEQRLILETARRLGTDGVRWLVPRWDDATRPSWWRAPMARIRALATDRAARRLLRVGEGLVPEGRIPVYFGAADVVFIPRIRALNSGVLPLAHALATPVVGPEVGNIGALLEETGNFTYEAGDAAAAAVALRAARSAELEALGARNRTHAARAWNWKDVARRHEALYRRLTGRDAGPGPTRG